jgi:hypothetical protein
MPASRKVLEDSIRLARIRSIKRSLYVVQVVMLVALAFLLIVLMGGARIEPVFYLPLDTFTAVMVLLILVIFIEGFFFRTMEIRFARSSSARHLMAKTSMRFALGAAIVAALVASVLMVPGVISSIEKLGDRTSALTSVEDVAFWSTDSLALQRVYEVRASVPLTIDPETGDPVMFEIYLVDDNVYIQYDGRLSDMLSARQNYDNYIFEEELVIEVPATEHTLFHLVLNDLKSPGAVVTVTMAKQASEAFTGVVALLSIAIVAANLAWVAYLVPIERKYSAGSIYK